MVRVVLSPALKRGGSGGRSSDAQQPGGGSPQCRNSRRTVSLRPSHTYPHRGFYLRKGIFFFDAAPISVEKTRGPRPSSLPTPNASGRAVLPTPPCLPTSPSDSSRPRGLLPPDSPPQRCANTPSPRNLHPFLACVNSDSHEHARRSREWVNTTADPRVRFSHVVANKKIFLCKVIVFTNFAGLSV